MGAEAGTQTEWGFRRHAYGRLSFSDTSLDGGGQLVGTDGLSIDVSFSISEQLLRRNVKRFRGGLASKAHRLVYHSTLGWIVIQKEEVMPRRRCRRHMDVSGWTDSQEDGTRKVLAYSRFLALFGSENTGGRLKASLARFQGVGLRVEGFDDESGHSNRRGATLAS